MPRTTDTSTVKKSILWRVYLVYLGLIALCLLIFGRAVYIQQVEGKYWRSIAQQQHQRIEEIEAERGTIFSEDGQMLSTSIPQFDVYIDFGADGLREKSGKRFRENVDSLSMGLATLFADRSADEYRRLLENGYRKKVRYFPFKRKISFRQYQALQQLPLVRQGRNKSGFVAEDRSIRLNPYQLLAYRTIGLDRENAQKVGLEQTYDQYLKGTTGKRLVRNIGGGVSVPVNEEFQIEPENGKDIVTTLDVHIQEVTENALLRMMKQNDADHGCAIVMEVKTGKVKAIANLGRVKDSTYWENFNYSLTPTEPGSTFKLATIMSVFDDGKATLNTPVNLEGGTWNVGRRTVYDSEKHGRSLVTLKQAFELSSNVGMAKIVQQAYGAQPSRFVQHLKRWGMADRTGIDLQGEARPVVYDPKSSQWSNTTLPWMAFGYNLTITPLRTAMLYNAVANNGMLMKPYLVNSVQHHNEVVKAFEPQVISSSVCKPSTLSMVRACLEGVCSEPTGTAYNLFKTAPYKAAGKTGTALVADGKRGYDAKIYQSSFAGYFPADDPQFTIVVIIKNKPHAPVFYGASVAGPVWREIADRLYNLYVRQGQVQMATANVDSGYRRLYTGTQSDVQALLKQLQPGAVPATDESADYALLKAGQGTQPRPLNYNQRRLPNLSGLTLRDAIAQVEAFGARARVQGKGRVVAQSVAAGTTLQKGQTLTLTLQ